MLPDAARSYGDRNVSVADEAVRKAARSRSRQTGKPVAQSSVTQTFEGFPLPGLKMSVTTVGPPQLDDERIFLLAQYQLSGFFYALTYDFAEDRGGFWPGGFFPITYAPRSDWSNPVQMWFMHRVLSWLPRAVGTFASGFFRIAIRRSPEADVWSWALEWNQNIRVIGFFGEEESALPIKGEMPELPMNVVGTLPGGGVLRMRSEVPLKEEDDVLFYAQELQDASERSTSSEGSVESNCGDESTLSEP
ncbi:MAG TPA: hypothetical protein VJ276_10720 [Thermoanaerobaculia bacterium]|nr:hypothetical protein [Thermoanaerobaculia bacterium]